MIYKVEKIHILPCASGKQMPNRNCSVGRKQIDK